MIVFKLNEPGLLVPDCAKVSIILTMFFLALVARPAAALQPHQLYEKLAPSVWRVYAYDRQGKPFSQGSGVVIAKDAVITNCHVVAQGASFTVNQDNQAYEAKLTYADPARDMCQLNIRNFSAPAVTIGDSETVGVGERIYALGNPRGMELTLSDGLVSALRKDDAKHLYLIQITAPISPGSSGGGVFDEDGNLIGITTLQVVNGQNLNLAIPINWLKDLGTRSTSGGMSQFQALNKAAEAKAVADAKAAAEKAAREKAAADRATAEKIALEKILADKVVAERNAAQHAGVTPSGYAGLSDIDKFKRVSNRPSAEANYRRFLSYAIPRAFAVADDGHTWGTWGLEPSDPSAPKLPSARAVWACEKEYQQRCSLYAVDNTVVYQDRGSPSTDLGERLIGKWRHVELTRVVDGKQLVPQKIDGDYFVEFKRDNTWQAIGPNSKSAGTYRWINPEQIEQTILESNLAIQIGLVSIKKVKVDNQRLEFSIEQTASEREKILPPPKAGVIRQIDTMVITKFDRVIQ